MIETAIAARIRGFAEHELEGQGRPVNSTTRSRAERCQGQGVGNRCTRERPEIGIKRVVPVGKRNTFTNFVTGESAVDVRRQGARSTLGRPTACQRTIDEIPDRQCTAIIGCIIGGILKVSRARTPRQLASGGSLHTITDSISGTPRSV